MIAAHAASDSSSGPSDATSSLGDGVTVSNGGRLPTGSVTLADGAPAGAAHAASSRRAASGAARRGVVIIGIQTTSGLRRFHRIVTGAVQDRKGRVAWEAHIGL